MKKDYKDRLGQIRKNNYGSMMKVVEYNNSLDIRVKFIEHNYLTTSSWGEFIKGKIKSPYDKSVFKVGFIGIGDYKVWENDKMTPEYSTWRRMLERCYSPIEQKRSPTYKGCVVAEEWHNFQNFAKWYTDNYYEVKLDTMNLDKDILVKGNKLYSPKTCVFVPKRINGLFLKSTARRGSLPIGVYYVKDKNRYGSKFNIGNRKAKFLGYFQSPEVAFNEYKFHKENYIKELAEEYKTVIPNNLYEAMNKYIVEITD